MLQLLKRFGLVALLLGSVQSTFAFALLGPTAFNEAYQVGAIGYGLPAVSALGDAFPVDVGAPKNFGQGYRWTTPTNYYAFDASFATYFGPQGMAAVDQAFAMFNNLSNFSSYSSNLSEWPFKASRANGQAEALELLDVKSITMELVIEQLGLASPDRWTWALHNRNPIANEPCPAFDYFVIQRNFDPLTYTYTNVVNGQLLGYTIVELCGLNPNTFAPLLADAEEYTTDPKNALTSVASFGLPPGDFYTGFTRDDIGGLRYLYAPTNVVNENVPTNVFELSTNTLLTTLTTSNLTLFLEQAQVLDPATLTTIYPGLQILSFTNFFTNIVTTNFTFFITNGGVGTPVGNFRLGIAQTFTTNVETLFSYVFGNVIIVHSNFPATQVIQQVAVVPAVGGIPGTVQTNFVDTTIPLPFPSGDFYILPANLCGPYVNPDGSPGPPTGMFNDLQLGTLVQLTNAVVNGAITTTVTVGTNAVGVSGSLFVNTVDTFTNFTYIVREVDCQSNTVATRQGMDHITFVRRDFDGLLSGIWDPITNIYTLTAVSNAPIVQTFRRIVTRPDFLFTTGDLVAGPQQLPAFSTINRSTPNFDTTLAGLAGQPGPGTIAPGVSGVSFTFNDVGPLFANSGPFFKNLGTIGSGFDGTPDTNSTQEVTRWGSFDGTTNAPIVYPNNVSLADLEAAIYFQIVTPSPLPPGKVGSVYDLNGVGPGTNGVQLMATGATTNSPPQSPYIWNSVSGLPSGLSVSSSGILSGTPTKAGTNNFTVQAMDAGQRVTTAILQIVVTP